MYHGKRRRQHIREKAHWTRCAGDWQEVFCRAVETRDEARELEMKIKKRGASRFLSLAKKAGEGA
jgi:predicted GIY-YIG superfamily endonuclease